MISKITIANLKAFGDEQSLLFATNAAADASKLTLLLGPNNSGKSTLVNAIEEFLTARSGIFTAAKEHRHGTKLPTLTAIFDGKAISLQPSQGSKFVVDGLPEEIRRSIRFLASRRSWTELFGSSMEEAAYRDNVRANRRQNRHYIDSQFGSALMHLSLDNIKKEQFSKLLKSVDPSIRDWRTETSGGQDFIEYLADVGEWHRIGDVGDGVSSIFRLCYEVLHLKPGDCLLIDEPELSLHPQVQRNLAGVLLRASVSNQLIVATHSPHFLTWKSLKRGAVACRLNMTPAGAKLSLLSASTLHPILSIADSDQKNIMLYDAVAKEVFFSRGALFVEGAEDANILRSYIDQNEIPEIEIFGYGSGGAPNIINWLTMCNELGIRAFGLYDGDPAGDEHYSRARDKFAGSPAIIVDRL
jgi:energy-coupling factor transporter ATP-binding protein EcfA2